MDCTDCEFGLNCQTNCIEGEGSTKAPIMIVGECPSITDDEKGQAFAGDSGSKLEYLLHKAKIPMSKVYLTYAVKCKPPYKLDQVKKDHIEACQKHLAHEIFRIKPKVIVAMGKIAIQSLKGVKGPTVSDHRGWFQEYELEYKTGKFFNSQIISTYSPTTVLTKWEWDQIVVHDLKKAWKFLKQGLPKEPKLEVKTATDLKTLNQFVKELCSAKRFTFDFETTGLSFFKHKIINAGFCIKPGQAMVIPLFEYADGNWEADRPKDSWKLISKKWDEKNIDFALNKINPFVRKHKAKIHEAMKKIFSSPALKDAQNGKFDVKFAKYAGFPVKHFSFDTMIAHSLINENLPHGLTFILDFYGIDYGAYDQQLWQYTNKEKKNKKPYYYVPPLLLSEYIGRDVDGTARMRPLLIRDLKKEKMVSLFKKQQMPLVKMMIDCEYRGMKIDVKKLQTLASQFAKMLAIIDKKIKIVTKNKDFNPNSPQQLAKYLESINAFDWLENHGRVKKTPGGAMSTDESVLGVLAKSKKYGRVPRMIIESRTITKLKSNYLDGKDGTSGMLSWVDRKGNVHYNSNIHTPRTGRMSVDDPGLHTVPRPNPKYPEANIRQLFIPSKKGNVIASVDFKQLEMCIVAYLSQDPVMIREIQLGMDMHSRNAVNFGTNFGFLPPDMTVKKFIKIKDYVGDELKKRKRAAEYSEIRTFSKALGFGLNYGIEANTLANDHNREIEEVQEMIDLYFEKYEIYAVWREEQCAISIEKGLLRLPETGRKRRFIGASDWFNSEYAADCQKREYDISAVHRQAMNYPVQGYANEIFVAGGNYQGGILALHKTIKREKLKTKILLPQHDGLLLDGPKKEMRRIHELSKKCLERTLGSGKNAVPLIIDFDVYDRWAGTKVEI